MVNWLAGRWNALIDYLWKLLVSAYDMGRELLLWLFDGLTGIAVTMLEGTSDVFSALDITQYVQALPPETRQVLTLIGIGEATAMIVVAIGVRLTLQLIPFVRLGS